MDISLRPYFSSGSGVVFGSNVPLMPIMIGTLGP